MSSLKQRIIERLQGRADNAEKTMRSHPEFGAQLDSAVRRLAYLTAVADVEDIFRDFDIPPTKLEVMVSRCLFVLQCGCQITGSGRLQHRCVKHEYLGESGTLLTREQLNELNPLVPDPQLQPVPGESVRQDPAQPDGQAPQDPPK
jgi:hypothetical protein